MLREVAADRREYESNWEPESAKLPVVISFPGTELKSRNVVIGLEVGSVERAYPLDTILKQSPVEDHVGGTPVLLVVGPDQKSVRGFVSRVDKSDGEFFRKSDAPGWVLVDSISASEWNFKGCAVTGPATGKCLRALPAIKDFWFDWRNYHPGTAVYRH